MRKWMKHSAAMIAGLSLATLSACGTPHSEGDAAHHDHHGDHSDHEMAEVEADTATLEEVRAAKESHTLPFYNSEEFSPVWLDPEDKELDGFHQVPQFQFVNQNGSSVTSESYDDKIYVATFFFATCPGICSPINNRLLTVQEAISDKEDVRILSHSITPEIDTVSVLSDYASEHDIDASTWDLVTGERDKVYTVAKDGYFASEDLGESEAEGDFKHTENILLIDRNGRIRGIYNGLSRNAMLNVIADIELLRKEQPSV